MESYEHQTKVHIAMVEMFLKKSIEELEHRAETHDESKFQEPEFSLGEKMSKELEPVEYGSPEYFSVLKKYEENIQIHYKKNRHHPEHFENGISGMNLVDVIEMSCDWYASILQRNPGITAEEAKEKVKLNLDRFEVEGQLRDVILNSI